MHETAAATIITTTTTVIITVSSSLAAAGGAAVVVIRTLPILALVAVSGGVLMPVIGAGEDVYGSDSSAQSAHRTSLDVKQFSSAGREAVR